MIRNISYKLTDATLLRWDFQYAFDEYEVTRGAREGVVLQYQEISSGFGIEHQLNETFKVTVSAGGVFNRQLGYKDDVGKVAPETGFLYQRAFNSFVLILHIHSYK